MTVTAEAGTKDGDVVLTVTGYTPDTGESSVIKFTDAPEDVTYGDDLSSWDAWDGTEEVTPTKDIINVAVVDANNKAIAFGYLAPVPASNIVQ